MIGYRFDFKKHEVAQSGLIQFDSRPRGAKVTIDGKPISGRTATKSMASSGSHNVSMTLDGYLPWQKTVSVDPGAILWLSYARMIPSDIITTDVASFTSVANTLSVPDASTIFVMQSAVRPEITQITGDNVTAKQRTITIPNSIITTAKKASTSKYRLVSSDMSANYLIIEHRYDKTTEWLYVNADVPEQSLNISRYAKVPLGSLRFDPTNNRIVYALTNSNVLAFDAAKQTFSAPLVDGVAQYDVDARGNVLYVSNFDASGSKRSIGYLTKGATKPKVIRTFYTNSSLPIQFIENNYIDQNYFVLHYGTTLEISSGNLPASDSATSVLLSSVATISLTNQNSNISFSPTNRFIVVAYGETFMTYDLELNKLSTVSQRGDGTPNPIEWIDQTSLVSTRGGTLQYYEFDGENSHQLQSGVLANSTVYAPNAQAIYTLARDGGAIKLVRISLIAG